jgi:hypothetical protein
MSGVIEVGSIAPAAARCMVCTKYVGESNGDKKKYTGDGGTVVGTTGVNDPVDKMLVMCVSCRDEHEDTMFNPYKTLDESIKSYGTYLRLDVGNRVDSDFYRDEIVPIMRACESNDWNALMLNSAGPVADLQIYRYAESGSKNSLSLACCACGKVGPTSHFIAENMNHGVRSRGHTGTYLDDGCTKRLLVAVAMYREIGNARRLMGMIPTDTLYHTWRDVMGSIISILQDEDDDDDVKDENNDAKNPEAGANGNTDNPEPGAKFLAHCLHMSPACIDEMISACKQCKVVDTDNSNV